ncbi:MAG TPA: hypothetical protein VHE30_26835 [Polyangiaceae bacterium]|nr:hypothetical protein [Polyangiaceae bacterium]
MPISTLTRGFGPHGVVSGAELASTLIVLALGLVAIALVAFRTRNRPIDAFHPGTPPPGERASFAHP